MNDTETGFQGLQMIDGDGDVETTAAAPAMPSPLAAETTSDPAVPTSSPITPIAMEQPDVPAPAMAASGGGGTHTRLLIIGSGPAGLTAAIYAARADLEPIVVAGYVAGGQLMITSDVENYPGFADGIQGPELMAAMRAQAERFGARIHDLDVEKVDLSERPFKAVASGTEFTADAVVVATGASALWLELENETRLRGRGVSACATCDGFFFRDRKVAVVGGGDSALEEALFLTKFASEVTMIHRRDEFRGSRIMQKRAFEHPKITIRWNTQVTDVLGKDKIEGLRLKDTRTGEEVDEPFEGLFVAIGHTPNTDVFKDWLETDAKGYLVVDDHTRTRIEGVFVAGDVHDSRYRQAVTAAGDGCKAAIDAERWLAEQEEGEGSAAEGEATQAKDEAEAVPVA